MAQTNESHLKLTPEEKLALRTLSRRQLQVPVDVEGLLGSLAVIEELDLATFGVDALCISGRRHKPKVFINRQQHPLRKRFTIAHEIGHLLIPWHVGSLGCHTEVGHETSSFIHGFTEAEANRFASCLLLPPHWVAEVAAAASNVAAATDEICDRARVSAGAACYALTRVLPPGFFFIQESTGRVVGLSGRSASTAAEIPERGETLDLTRWSAFKAHPCRDERTTWFEYVEETISAPPGRASTELLRELLHRYGQDNLFQSVQGVVGCAISSQDRANPARVFSIIHQRFVGREKFSAFVTDQQFTEYLTARAYELSARASPTARK